LHDASPYQTDTHLIGLSVCLSVGERGGSCYL